jgi:Flp pilus assembly protein TadD
VGGGARITRPFFGPESSMAVTRIVRIAALARAFSVCLAAGATAFLLAACASTTAPSLDAADAASDAQAQKRNETGQTVEGLAKAYTQNPKDPRTALAYASKLKAAGQKQQALAVLQQAAAANEGNRSLLSEYGRLALELEQVSLAQGLLEQADDASHPDWRVLSARGTVFAKQGKYRDAIPYYERALALAPGQPSVLNNLALAQAMEGDAEKAETLLKQAVATGNQEARIHQNLALVLSLQGKYDEAKLTGARLLPADQVVANVDYVKSMVQLEPKPLEPAAAKPLKPTPSAAGVQRKAASQGGKQPSAWVTRVAEVKPSD